MAELTCSGLRAEQELVAELLNEALAELPEGLMQFVRSEVEEEQLLAGIVLASAAPENDTDEAISRRTALAAALELLQVALKIHRLLLTPAQPDTIDSFLLGGTILAGDYCFSRAAVLAARTNHPQVVSVFAELLKEVSQVNLRHAIADNKACPNATAADEREALFRSGALAGVLLAGLAEDEQLRVARYASRLSRRGLTDGTGAFDSEPDNAPDDDLPMHQRERWRAIVSAIR